MKYLENFFTDLEKQIVSKCIIGNNTSLGLRDIDNGLDANGDTSGFDRKKFITLKNKLGQLQRQLYVYGKHKMLIIFQGVDLSGKDSTIQDVFTGLNPQGLHIVHFLTKLTPREVSHDYLWRIHQHTPEYGQMVVFNRSHYEDILTPRVHNLLPYKTWNKRYKHIVDFERMLSDEGVKIIKIFLYVSKEEQGKRLKRITNIPALHWQFNPADEKEHALWDDYMQAYKDVIYKTTTNYAPWHIVDAKNRWYRNCLVTGIIMHNLRNLAS